MVEDQGPVLAVGALECLTSPENQAVNAELTGNMPSSEAGYDEKKVQELFPGDLLELFQESLEAAAPRTVSIAMVRDLYSGREMARIIPSCFAVTKSDKDFATGLAGNSASCC